MTAEEFQALQKTQAQVAEATAELRRLEGQRDAIVARMTDSEGCNSNRSAATR